MVFDGYHLDLLYVQLLRPSIPPEFDPTDDSVFHDIADDASARSINGIRVADLLLKSVPNIESFRLTLRAVKFWSKRTSIFDSSILRFRKSVCFRPRNLFEPNWISRRCELGHSCCSCLSVVSSELSSFSVVTKVFLVRCLLLRAVY